MVIKIIKSHASSDNILFSRLRFANKNIFIAITNIYIYIYVFVYVCDKVSKHFSSNTVE